MHDYENKNIICLGRVLKFSRNLNCDGRVQHNHRIKARHVKGKFLYDVRF